MMTSDRQHERLGEGKELGERLEKGRGWRLSNTEDRENYSEGISGQVLNSLIDLFFY